MLQRIQAAKANKAAGIQPITQPAAPRAVNTQPRPQVASPIVTPQKEKLPYFSGTGLQKAFDVLQTPEFMLAGFQKAALVERDRQRLTGETKSKSYLSNIGSRFKKGILNVPAGVATRTAFGAETGDVNMGKELGIKNKYGQGAYNLGLSLAMPAAPLGKVAKLTGKVGSKIPGVANAVNKTTSAVGTFARKTPAIYKPLEATVAPYFRNPEVGNMIKNTRKVTERKINQLYTQISEAAKGLSAAKQARIGQLLEGGISTDKTDKQLVAIADQFRKVAEEQGREAVELGLLNPESYKNLKGTYMKHIWDKTVKGENPFDNIKSTVPEISGQFSKQRKGAEGYVREFAAPTMKGLGAGTADIEAAKLYKELAQKFGISSEKLTPPDDLARSLVDTLKTSYKPPKKGLGETPPGFVDKENIGSELLDVYRNYQPAKVAGTNLPMDTTAVVGKVKGGEEILERSEILDPQTEQVVASVMKELGFKPTKANMTAFLEKVGELPLPKKVANRLKLGTQIRNIPENYGLASDVLTKKKGGQFFKDTAMPNEVLDYMTRAATKSKPGPILKTYDTAMNAWKMGKTILNPAYHVRNVLSNQILNSMQTNRNIMRVIPSYIKTATTFRKSNPLYKEAVEIGLIRRKYVGGMVDEFLDEGLKKKEGWLGNIKKGWDKVSTPPKELQNWAEDTAKLDVYSFFRNKGKSAEEAMDLAEEAIFSPYRLNPEELKNVSRAIPFYSFFRQAFPFTAKTYVNRPNQIKQFASYKKGVESLSPGEKEKERRPEYAKDYVRLPKKDKEGDSAYFDPTYTYPFGQFADFGGEGKLPFGLGLNPIIGEGAQQFANRDFYFNKDIKTSNIPEKRTKQWQEHLERTAAPQAWVTGKYKVAPAIRGDVDYAGRKRSVPMSILDAFGLKMSILRPEEQAKFDSWDKQTKLKSITKEQQTIMRDKRIPPAEKKEQIQKLFEVRREVLSQK